MIRFSAPLLTVLAGCVQGVAAAPGAVPARTTLAYDGTDYRIVDGADISLVRAARPMGFDEGLTAKRVAESHCAARGRRLNPVALGRFQSGAWVFNGGCA